MIPITDLLSRFKNLSNTEKMKKILISEIISGVVPVLVNDKEVSFVKKTIFLKIHPLKKTEILLKKTEILEKLKRIESLAYFSNIQ